MGVKISMFSGIQRHNYCSDFKFSLYAVTYYKVTYLYPKFFFLNSIIYGKNLRKPCLIWHKRAIQATCTLKLTQKVIYIYHWKRQPYFFLANLFLKQGIRSGYVMRKKKRSDSVLWQNPRHQQNCQKGKMTTQTTSQKSSITQRLRTWLHDIL